jgi:hypothetical protein
VEAGSFRTRQIKREPATSDRQPASNVISPQ